eukprot:scaffold679837_cov57-Prasinocladus_malaysianus.AAC.1
MYHSCQQVVLESGYGPPADIWSCGAVLHLMLSGELPFDSTTPVDLYHGIVHEEVHCSSPAWHAISEAAKGLVFSMLSKDPAARPSVKDVLAHEWLQKTEMASSSPLEDTVSKGIA